MRLSSQHITPLLAGLTLALFSVCLRQVYLYNGETSGRLEVKELRIQNATMANTTTLCTRQQVLDGRWYKDVLNKPPYITPTVHLRCFPKETYYSSPYISYKWKPNEPCRFHSHFRPKSFCERAKNSIVAIIGDSLSWEHYSSLLQLNGRRTHQNFQHQSRELRTNVVQHVCRNRTAVIYRRDDKLEQLDQALSEHAPDVLVLNRGAHYVPDEELLEGIDHNIQQVREWLQKCRAEGRQCQFFWRTSVPGHPTCHNFTEPVNDIRTVEALIANRSLYNSKTINYHWYDYQHQNELVLTRLTASGIPYTVIDGYHLNVRRPDEHRAHQDDCLHNCYPGKMDVYNSLMLHYLQNLSSRRTSLPSETIYDPVATETAKQVRLASPRRHGD